MSHEGLVNCRSEIFLEMREVFAGLGFKADFRHFRQVYLRFGVVFAATDSSGFQCVPLAATETAAGPGSARGTTASPPGHARECATRASRTITYSTRERTPAA